MATPAPALPAAMGHAGRAVSRDVGRGSDAHARRDGIRSADRDRKGLDDGPEPRIGAPDLDAIGLPDGAEDLVVQQFVAAGGDIEGGARGEERVGVAPAGCVTAAEFGCELTVSSTATRLLRGWLATAILLERAISVGAVRSIVDVAVTALVVPAALVSVTLKVTVPSPKVERSMPVTSWVAEVTLPLPVTGTDDPLPVIE